MVLLQVLIIATGNYNFFNILTIALCIPLVDDDIILGGPRKKKLRGVWGLLANLVSILVPGLVLGFAAYFTHKLFSLEVAPDFSIKSKIAFSEKQFLDWLERIMPWTMRLGAASLALEIVVSLVRSFTWYKSFLRRNWMTGVGGRPEVIVEGSFEKDSGWKEYNFLYKPGNVSARPPVVAPHQPRLDWQMWFAALDNYQLNPWFVTLMYRLLTAQPEVLELMGDNPFPDKAPNYVRATLYSTTDWWWRTRQAEYIPVMSKDLGTLKEFLQHYRILEKPPKPPAPTVLSKGLKWIRAQVGQPEGFTFVMSAFVSGLIIQILSLLI
nr:hypothetical protein BaRGS_012746 [Batillaria attramentaria]